MDFKYRLSIPQETDVILEDKLNFLSEFSPYSVVLDDILIQNQPEIKVAQLRVEENELENKVNFYREKLTQILPYLLLSIISNKPTIEAGIRLSYNFGPLFS